MGKGSNSGNRANKKTLQQIDDIVRPKAFGKYFPTYARSTQPLNKIRIYKIKRLPTIPSVEGQEDKY